MTPPQSKAVLAWDLAEAQLHLITHRQLRNLDFSEAEIKHRRQTRRLWPLYPGVYAVGHPGMTPARERMAAVLACGEHSAMTLMSAAVHWRVWEGPEPVRHHVAVPDRSGRRGARKTGSDDEAERALADRIQIHRPTTLVMGRHVETFEGVRVTTLQRTLRDLAGTLTPKQLPAVFRQAERVHDFDLTLLRAEVSDAPPTAWREQRIRKALGVLLDDLGLTQSEREQLFLGICRSHGIRAPIPQHPFGTRRADFLWPDLMLLAEIDDRQSHDGYVAFTHDRRRDRDAMNRGLEVIRFTVAECRHQPDLVAADTQQAIARRTRLLALGLLGATAA